MHSVFRLPWSSEPVGDKFSNPYNGLVEFPFVNKLKRKLADTADLSPGHPQRRMHPFKKSKPASVSQNSLATPHSPTPFRDTALVPAQLPRHQLPRHQLPTYAVAKTCRRDAPARPEPEHAQFPAARPAMNASLNDAPPSSRPPVLENLSGVSSSQLEQPSKAVAIAPSLSRPPVPENPSVISSSRCEQPSRAVAIVPSPSRPSVPKNPSAISSDRSGQPSNAVAVVPSSSRLPVPENPSAISSDRPEQPSKAVAVASSSSTLSPPLPSLPLCNTIPCSRFAARDETNVDATDRAASLRETIESHFNYEILLKHREVQLIEQELAKCRISLEQLRRCHLIPYPGVLAMSEEVSNGVGSALRAEKHMAQPECPPPWGITDGPYSRHYAKWLIPDARFDVMSKEDEAALAKNKRHPASQARATRATLVEHSACALGTTSGKARLSRTSAGNRPYASGLESPTLIRERQVPLVIKRSTDGQYVKLVCNDCHRGNFSSAQGFLNHCRIAHHRDYKSHDAAAVACGQIVEDETLLNFMAHSNERQGQAQENDEQARCLYPAQVSQPQLQPQSNIVASSVHPLIRETEASPGEIRVSAYKLPPRKLDSVNASGKISDTNKHRSNTDAGSGTFVSSSETPHLSALLRERGFSGNLQTMVAESRESIDLASAAESSSTGEGEEEIDTNYAVSVMANPEVVPAGTERLQSGSKSRMAERSSEPLRVSREANFDSALIDSTSGMAASALATSLPMAASASIAVLDPASTTTFSPDMELSPNTADSSNPGLVSDRDDDFLDEDDLENEEEHVFRPEQAKSFKQGEKLKANMAGIEMSEAPPAVRVAYFSGNQHDDAAEEDLDIGAVKFAAKSK